MELFHCFGARPGHRVTADQAVRMLAASGCRYLAVNTHTIADVRHGDDLPIGYWTATLGSVRTLLGTESGVSPVLNINHPTTAQEATSRTTRAVQLTGIRVIKLEVLDASLTVSRNDLVVPATRALVRDGLEVWPLITPDPVAFAACVEMGCRMVRVMGSPIGTRRGIDAGWLSPIRDLLATATVPVMLDGGIGSPSEVAQARDLGFSSVLVNSCLFADGTDPVAALCHFRSAVEGSPARA